ncbi:MAG: hypothetical protein NC410_02615 [Oscillibacter sp.]|nr:hypothetical protein [Oscillibacter sp.]
MADWLTTKKDGNTISVTAAENTGAARSSNLIIQGDGITLKIPITQEEGLPTDYHLTKVTILEPRYSVPTTYKFDIPGWFAHGDTLEVQFNTKVYSNTRFTVRFEFDTPEDLLMNPTRDFKTIESTNMSDIEDRYASNYNGMVISGLTTNSNKDFSHTMQLYVRGDSTKCLSFRMVGIAS